MMNNEEIRATIQQHQNALLEHLTEKGTFELDETAAQHQKAIRELRQKCDHLNPDGKIQVFNGRCIYCGTKI